MDKEPKNLQKTARAVGIFEPNHGGHRLNYVKYLASHLIHEGDTRIVLITREKSLRSDEFKIYLEPLRSSIDVVLLDSDLHANLQNIAYRENLDLVVVPDGDAIVWKTLWRKGWSAPGSISCLVMRPSGQSPHATLRILSTILKRTLMHLCNHWHGIHVYRLTSALSSERNKKYSVPDPITLSPDEEQLRTIWPSNKSNEAVKWVGIAGGLDERKNVPLFLESVLQVDNSKLGVVLAGCMDEMTQRRSKSLIAEIQNRSIPLIRLDTFMTDGQLDALIAELHAVVIAHSNEGPSGILGKAAQAGTHVVAAGAQSLKSDCEALGETGQWSPLTREGIAKSISLCLERPPAKPIELAGPRTFGEKLTQKATRKQTKLC